MRSVLRYLPIELCKFPVHFLKAILAPNARQSEDSVKSAYTWAPVCRYEILSIAVSPESLNGMLVLCSLTLERPLRYNDAVKVNLAQFRTVLFDLDGTLVETHIDFAEMRRGVRDIVMRYIKEENGIREDMDILQTIVSASNFLEMQGEHNMAVSLKKEADGFMEQMENSQCANPTIIPLARELLMELKSRRVNVCVVTRNNRNMALRLMAQCNLQYDLLLAREDIPHPKPHPDHLLRGIHLSGGDPSSSCMVGDHWMDISAGKKAGIPTVGLLKGRPKSYFQSEAPHYFVEDIKALFEGLDWNR